MLFLRGKKSADQLVQIASGILVLLALHEGKQFVHKCDNSFTCHTGICDIPGIAIPPAMSESEYLEIAEHSSHDVIHFVSYPGRKRFCHFLSGSNNTQSLEPLLLGYILQEAGHSLDLGTFGNDWKERDFVPSTLNDLFKFNGGPGPQRHQKLRPPD